MNQFELDKMLKAEKDNETPMSDFVRSRLEQTYSSLSEEKLNTGARSERSGNRRRILGTGAVAAVLGVTLFASGFASPAMADSIRQIPLIGSLFSSIERDLGLQNAANEGLTSQVNSNVSYKDVKLEVTETVFDGSRAVYALTVVAPNLHDGVYDTGKKSVKLSNAIDDITFKVNGEEFNGGGQYWGAGKDHPNTIIVEQSFKPSAEGTKLAAPDAFDAEVEVKLADIDHTFTLNVPFTKKTDDVIHLKLHAVKTAGDLLFTVNAVDVTPITTTLEYSLEKVSETPLSKQDEHDLIYTNVAVYDDQGHLLDRLGGQGIIQGNKFIKTVHYPSASSQTKYLILKPFKNNDGDFPKEIKKSQFVDGLDIRIDLPHTAQ
ncbi:hypothetical protein J2Z22_001730 [Paenibacillus forsythiae]|uniref:DUF4179 domain-containing protein n=1 Tax=Paenibacillus forsythiae TaxID=365616 RepID=A0ABU3H5U9_9BACL|nr:DUF4179 domain-containing protein [Paenibacillus forsythiae]MDT3426204.1 hypothetical protein [Paenibacillus forsythiae]